MTPHARARVAAAVTLLSTVLLVAGCATTVSGTGHSGAPSASGFPSSPGASSPATTPSATTSSTAAVQVDQQLPESLALTHTLSDAPAGSTPWTSAWAREVTPTVQQFVTQLYDSSDRQTVETDLISEGIDGLAHRAWYAANNDQADDVLLHFDNSVGADDRYTLDLHATSNDPTEKTFPVTGFPGGAQVSGFYDPTPDSYGNVAGKVTAVSGSTVMFFNFFSPKTLDAPTAAAWAAAQFGRL